MTKVNLDNTKFCILVALGIALIGTGSASASIVGFTTATNNRFTNSSDYILNSFDVSGVGKEPDVTGETGEFSAWATAISRNVVISAFHARPSGEVHFFADNNPTTTPVIRNVVSGQRIGSTDMWMGVLDTPLPSAISHFELADEFLSGPAGALVSAGSFQAENAYLFAQNRRADSPEQDQRTGRNRVSGYIENIDFLGLGDNDSILFEFDGSTHPDFVTHETRFISHDSGGPTFLDIDGRLTILGVNSFTYSTTDGRTGSGVTYVGNQSTAIQSYIAQNAIIVSPVPEPSSIVMFGLSAVFLIRRRRNKPSDRLT